MARMKRVGYLMKLCCHVEFEWYVSADQVTDFDDDAPFINDSVLELLEKDISKLLSRKYKLHDVTVIDDGFDACTIHAVTESGRKIKGAAPLRKRAGVGPAPFATRRVSRAKTSPKSKKR